MLTDRFISILKNKNKKWNSWTQLIHTNSFFCNEQLKYSIFNFYFNFETIEDNKNIKVSRRKLGQEKNFSWYAKFFFSVM